MQACGLDSAGEQHALYGVYHTVTLPACAQSLGTGEAADGVPARAERGSDWVLLAESTGHGTAESLQLPFKFPCPR